MRENGLESNSYRCFLPGRAVLSTLPKHRRPQDGSNSVLQNLTVPMVELERPRTRYLELWVPVPTVANLLCELG